MICVRMLGTAHNKCNLTKAKKPVAFFEPCDGTTAYQTRRAGVVWPALAGAGWFPGHGPGARARHP